ncbi:MAG: DUF371 domain-containing protein [Candidatus Bathyarchaeota archaeon]|nr:DUF371 domain-containing protein [Candidatus Bathyarchaeota archaeon]
MARKREIIGAFGHELVRSTHGTTFEVTKDETLTTRGDCIIGVKANKGAADLSEDYKILARRADADIIVTIEADGIVETVRAKGDPRLTFTNPEDIVVRKSSYICERTVAVKADKAAADLSRELIKKLKNPNHKVTVTLTVETHQMRK